MSGVSGLYCASKRSIVFPREKQGSLRTMHITKVYVEHALSDVETESACCRSCRLKLTSFHASKMRRRPAAALRRPAASRRPAAAEVENALRAVEPTSGSTGPLSEHGSRAGWGRRQYCCQQASTPRRKKVDDSTVHRVYVCR